MDHTGFLKIGCKTYLKPNVSNKSKLKVGFRACAARGDGSRKELVQIPREKSFCELQLRVAVPVVRRAVTA